MCQVQQSNNFDIALLLVTPVAVMAVFTCVEKDIFQRGSSTTNQRVPLILLMFSILLGSSKKMINYDQG